MISLFLLDVAEFRPVIECAAAAPGVTRRSVGRHVEVRSEGPLVVDRRATGVRHAVWYSAVSALTGGTVTQYDKDALRVEPA
jgi:hypothetical protein